MTMKKKAVMAGVLISVGVVARLWLYALLPDTPHLYITLAGIRQPLFMMDIFFMVAAASLVAGRYLGRIWAFVVPVMIMAVTDLLLGNSWIFLFTWSGFVMMGGIGYLSKSQGMAKFMGFGILSVLAYDLWTNFGCWLGWYTHTFQGLLLCYTVALPFMLWHVVATALVLPVFSLPLEKATAHTTTDAHPAPVKHVAGW